MLESRERLERGSVEVISLVAEFCPKWHVYSSAVEWLATFCRVSIPHDLNGQYRELSCLKNNFPKKDDTIIMCYGLNVITSWMLKKKPKSIRIGQ